MESQNHQYHHRMWCQKKTNSDDFLWQSQIMPVTSRCNLHCHWILWYHHQPFEHQQLRYIMPSPVIRTKTILKFLRCHKLWDDLNGLSRPPITRCSERITTSAAAPAFCPSRDLWHVSATESLVEDPVKGHLPLDGPINCLRDLWHVSASELLAKTLNSWGGAFWKRPNEL